MKVNLSVHQMFQFLIRKQDQDFGEMSPRVDTWTTPHPPRKHKNLLSWFFWENRSSIFVDQFSVFFPCYSHLTYFSKSSLPCRMLRGHNPLGSSSKSTCNQTWSRLTNNDQNDQMRSKLTGMDLIWPTGIKIYHKRPWLNIIKNSKI